MEKKGIHLGKDNKIFFVTKHHKEEALKPLLLSLGFECVTLPLDTDQFGTFSEEIKREDSVKDTLIKKINLGLEDQSHGNWFLASEGSFGPDPILSFITLNHEALCLYNRELKHGIFVQEIFYDVCCEESLVCSWEQVLDFCRKIKFPNHGVMLKIPEESFYKIKGIKSFDILNDAYTVLSQRSTEIFIKTDMRAHLNQTRMKNIKKLGEKLVEAIQSKCPNCNYLGFIVKDFVHGLECRNCLSPTRNYKAMIKTCDHCGHHEQLERADLSFADPSECDFCNP